MPAKNRIKIYGENSFYHVYNRGNNHQTIFHDEHDYNTFLYLFKKYLEEGFTERRVTPKGEEYFVEPKHVYEEIELLAYCLMPNHFHLLVFQKTREGMTKLLRRIITSYSNFFNHKYNLEGSPFQDIYKAVTIKTEEQLIHTSRYIHANPISITGLNGLSEYVYSSYPAYLSINKPRWLKPERVLGSFKNKEDYRKFVDEFVKTDLSVKRESLEPIKDLLLD